MANITETATFDTNIYRIDQNDPVQGWDGSSLGISNLQAQALANRTQYLKAIVDLGSRFTGMIPYNVVSSGGVKTLTPADMNGFLHRINTTNYDGVLTLPLAASCTDGANIGVTVEPAATLQFKSSNGRFVVLGPSGSDTFFDPETMQTTNNYTIHPFSMVRVYKIGSTNWMVVKEAAQENVPAGIVAPWAVNAPPYGWIECNGGAISRTTYARLFNNIGTTYGIGNGTTTFNLPDLRGEFIRGWDNGRGVDTNSQVLTCSITNTSVNATTASTTGLAVGMSVTGTGIPGGATIASITSGTAFTLSVAATATNASASLTFANRMFGSFENDDFKSHKHNIYRIPYFGISTGTNQGGIVYENIATNAGFDNDFTVAPTGSKGVINTTGGAETRPRNVAMMYCIKY